MPDSQFFAECGVSLDGGGAASVCFVITTKRTTIDRIFSSGFSRDFRTEISCFVPILCKIPVEWMNQNHKKGHKNRHHC
jgi:hypothetical protein